MNWFNTILILTTAFVAVFAQSALDFTRGTLGAQLDLLPPLVVYASLTGNVTSIALLSVCGGSLFDSLSANPLGVSVLPLFVVGFAIHRVRDVVLREQFTAQFIFGVIAGAAVPLLTVMLMLSAGHRSLLSWGSLWQLIVVSLGGGLVTPAAFRFFAMLNHVFNHRPNVESSFRPDREIRRGRN